MKIEDRYLFMDRVTKDDRIQVELIDEETGQTIVLVRCDRSAEANAAYTALLGFRRFLVENAKEGVRK